MEETKIYKITPFDINQLEILIDVLSVENIEGIEENENHCCVYVLQQNEANFISSLNELKNTISFDFSVENLENKNWNEIWESSFQPVIIDDLVSIKATFHTEKFDTKYTILIDPKMSFGTGHHATTSQMMKNMNLIDFKNKTVLDVGSGTAILAIFAEYLQAKKIIAIDNDEFCYTNSLENIALNNCTKIESILGVIDDFDTTKLYDIILANIHRNFLVEKMNLLAKLLTKNGFLLVSGFYTEDAKTILELALEYNLISNLYTSKDNWTCIVFEKK